MKRNLAHDALNSLTAHVAVLDSRGVIVLVNFAWKRFARENGSVDETSYVGASYLAVCEDAVRRGGDGAAQAAAQSLRALLRGEGNDYSLEYPCHSPAEKRWFMVRMTRFAREQDIYLVVAHEDITARKRAEDLRRETEKTLRQVLDTLPVGVWLMDVKGKIVHGNPASQRIWEGARYVGPEQFGDYRGWWASTGQPIAPDEWAAARAIKKGETSLDEEIRIECFDGSSKIILNSALPLHDAENRISGAIIVNQDITSRKRTEEQLAQTMTALEAANHELQQALDRERIMAQTDDLTGLNNRRHFLDLTTREFAVAQRYRHPLSILMIDVDHFKQVNDAFGHQVGDAMLQRVARVARECLRDADVLARYGGEEFIVSLPNTGVEGALVTAEHVREAIAAQRMDTGSGYVSVTISVGVAEAVPEADTLDRLIGRADHALNMAKQAGRNRTVVSSPTM